MLTFWVIFLFIILGVLIVWLTSYYLQVSNIRKNQEELNTKAEEYLHSKKFNVSKKFYLNDYATYNQEESCKKFIALDNENKKLCLIDYQKNSMLIVDFAEILNYEIYENGSNQTVGGNIGGFWGGLFTAETEGLCKDLKLIIRLKRYDISQISYEIIFNTTFNMGINKSTHTYKGCISTLQEVVSFLEVLKKENNN